MPSVGLIDMDGCGDADRDLGLWADGLFQTVHTDYGEYGGYGIQVLGIGGSITRYFEAGTYGPTTGFGRSEFIVGMGLNCRTITSTYTSVLLREGSTVHLQIRLYHDGSIQIRRGITTILASAPAGSFIPNTWLILGFGAVIHDSAGEVRLWLGGVGDPVIEATGLDTRNGGTGVVNNCHWGGDNDPGDLSRTTWIDDWYLVDSTVMDATQLGGFSIRRRAPISDATPNDWTPSTGTDHFAVVDEVPFSTSDYLTTSGDGDIELFDIASGSVGWDVVGVRVVGPMSKGSPDTALTRFIMSDDGNQMNGATRLLSTTSILWSDTFPQRWDDSDWDEAAVNALLIGVEKIAV